MFTNRPAIKKETPIHDQKNQTKFSELENDFFLIRDAVQKNLLADNNNNASYSFTDADLYQSIKLLPSEIIHLFLWLYALRCYTNPY